MNCWRGSRANRSIREPWTPPWPARSTARSWCSAAWCATTTGGRSVEALEYQAHPEAEHFLRRCCEQVAADSGLPVAAVHRVGDLTIGDLALVAAAAAPHRAEAFAVCAELVERIKREVPIWKRQRFDDGLSEWVGLDACADEHPGVG